MKKALVFFLVVFICHSLSAQTIVIQDFENGLGGWQAVSMNTGNNYYFGFNHLQTTAHSGSAYFQFSSYYSASDYNQYLISPRLNLTNEAVMSYYCVKASSNGTESFQIMVSTTDSAITSFSPIGSSINPTTTWTQHTVTLPANTRFVAFHYTSNYQYYMGIDDIVISMMSSTPEIGLTNMQLPSFANVGESFTVSGTVLNNSLMNLNRFEVSYTIDGITTTDSITGISVASGNSYSFTHPIAASITSSGLHSVLLTVSMPNGQADVITDNTLIDTINICGIISSLPHNEGFENGLNCWQAISMNNSNTCGVLSSTYAHNSSKFFRFSSWNSSSDYTQYLISPELSLASPTGLSFYARDVYDYGGESIQVMFSTTDDNTSSFFNLGEVITPSGSWRQYVRLVPANAKYVAIKYLAQNRYYTGIDDISFYEVSAAPEIELTELHAPLMAGDNTPFSLTGKIVNHCSTPITSFTVSYTIAGHTVTDNINGINIPYNEDYSFTIPTPVVVTTIGTYTISVAVSNPNGVTDDMTDNMLTTSVEIYESTTAVRRKVLMEHFSTASCPNCIDGHHYIESAIPGYEDDVIWVTHHTGYYSDRLTITPSIAFKSFYNDNGDSYAPAVMLDRTYFGNQEFTHAIGTPPGPVFYPYTDLNDGFAAAVSIPAYITVEFSSMNYDMTTRQLNVTVSGEVVHALDAIDPRLNVWLLEDDIIADGDTIPGHGPTQAYADANFTHDHVIRALLNADTWGEDNVIPSVAGETYSKSYTFTVSDRYIDSHCYLVAFVSEGNHSNINNCRVYNAEKSRRLTEAEPQEHDCSLALTYDNHPLLSDDTIHVGTINNMTVDVLVGFANISNEDIFIKVEKEEIEMATGAEAAFCVAGLCYGGNMSQSIPLVAGETIPAEDSRALHTSYRVSEGGVSIVKYTLFNIENSNDAISFYIHYMPENGIHSKNLSSIRIYPNPASDIIYISGMTQDSCPYVIYSLTGQKVTIGTTDGDVNISQLTAGVYILELQMNKDIKRMKFVVR